MLPKVFLTIHHDATEFLIFFIHSDFVNFCVFHDALKRLRGHG